MISRNVVLWQLHTRTDGSLLCNLWIRFKWYWYISTHGLVPSLPYLYIIPYLMCPSPALLKSPYPTFSLFFFFVLSPFLSLPLTVLATLSVFSHYLAKHSWSKLSSLSLICTSAHASLSLIFFFFSSCSMPQLDVCCPFTTARSQNMKKCVSFAHTPAHARGPPVNGRAPWRPSCHISCMPTNPLPPYKARTLSFWPRISTYPGLWTGSWCSHVLATTSCWF